MQSLPNLSDPLSADAAESLFSAMLDGALSPGQIETVLTRLADRGESVGEVVGAVRAMRSRVKSVSAPPGAIDVCGTGGDGQHSLNISTAVAIVVAACDVPVAKHGNRAASSKAGAADTLEALGLDLDKASDSAEKSLNDIGLCFLFAQKHHPSLGPIAPIRKAIGRRTIFNLIGPLANPAHVQRQLVGVATPALVPLYAQALAALGTERSIIVSGEEGIDELSLAGANVVAVVEHGQVRGETWTAADAGLPAAPLSDIRGGDASFNAAALRDLLAGGTGAYRNAVLFNAAAALMVAGVASSLAEGVEEAAEAIDKGLAKALLDCWIAFP